MKIKNTIFALTIVAAFMGCKAYEEKRAEKKLAKLEFSHPELFSIKNSDTTYKPQVKETKTIDTIILQGRATTYTLNIPCPTANVTAKAKSSQGYTPVSIKNDILTFKCPQDSLMEIITDIRDSVKTLEVKNTSGLAKTVITVNKPLTWWQTGLMFVGGIVVGLILLFFADKIFANGKILSAITKFLPF